MKGLHLVRPPMDKLNLSGIRVLSMRAPSARKRQTPDGSSFLWALLNYGLKESSLVTNRKLLTINSQLLSKMSDISTMTKFRAEQALVATLTGADRSLCLLAGR